MLACMFFVDIAVFFTARFSCNENLQKKVVDYIIAKNLHLGLIT